MQAQSQRTSSSLLAGAVGCRRAYRLGCLLLNGIDFFQTVPDSGAGLFRFFTDIACRFFDAFANFANALFHIGAHSLRILHDWVSLLGRRGRRRGGRAVLRDRSSSSQAECQGGNHNLFLVHSFSSNKINATVGKFTIFEHLRSTNDYFYIDLAGFFQCFQENRLKRADCARLASNKNVSAISCGTQYLLNQQFMTVKHQPQ